MSLAIWRELSKDDRISPKDRFGMWAVGASVALAGLTGKMIIENMLHRTVGKVASKATIPLFIISLAVSGGYMASMAIDPDKGRSRFTDALLDPVGSVRTTATIAAYHLQDFYVDNSPTDIMLQQPGLVFQDYVDDVFAVNAWLSKF